MSRKSASAGLFLLCLALQACDFGSSKSDMNQPIHEVSEVHVYPGQEIQSALDQAANDPAIHTVVVHAGTYAPPEHRQALIWFNDRHNGLHLKADGKVTLTAENESIADRSATSFPAVVNHVVYFGDGVSSKTRMSGFSITGANNYVTTKLGPRIESEIDAPRLAKTAFFYTNGGGVKVFGRSYPTLEDLHIFGNYASPCGAGISIEHRGYLDDHVTIKDCIFQNNRNPLTGSALDVLDHEYGSSIVVENCLFVGNLSNCKQDKRSEQLGTWKPKAGHGVATIFAHSKADFRRCTFFANRNGVDDLSRESFYSDCIFWNNQVRGGWATAERYEVDLVRPENLSNCFLFGNSYRVDPQTNMLEAPDPEFDSQFAPQNSLYDQVGYRPRSVKPTSFDRQSLSKTTENSTCDLELPEGTLNINVSGEAFAWNITYPGSIAGMDKNITVRRHLYVPTGTRVLLKIESKDFLYQLALPEHNVREIAVPGMSHRCSFVPERPGVFPLVGDQFCGYTHPDLIGKLIVKEPLEFKKWLCNQK